MTISEVALLLDQHIVVTEWGDGEQKYQAKLRTAHLLEGSLFIGEWAAGSTPKEALSKYCKKLSGQTVCAFARFDAPRLNLTHINVTLGNLKKSEYTLIPKR